MATEPTSVPSSRQLLALVSLVAVVLAAAVALYALTPVDGRTDIWHQLATAGPGVGALAGSVLAWLGVRQVRSEHGEALAQITHQTNGVLTERIAAAIDSALDARGFAVPADAPRRRSDTTPTTEEGP